MCVEPLPHLGRIGRLPCGCNGHGTCHPCKVRLALTHLEEAYPDDTKRARAVHELVRAIKEAAVQGDHK